jgi:hypothetical protein
MLSAPLTLFSGIEAGPLAFVGLRCLDGGRRREYA